MEKLKKWAELLNDREYMEELSEEEAKELKKDGIIVLFGASDDLCELRGAMNDEFDCWEGGRFAYVEERVCFVDVNYYKDNPDELIKIDLSARPYIDIEFGKNGWKYKLPNIPQADFNILDNGEQYCVGKVFYKFDFINWEKGE